MTLFGQYYVRYYDLLYKDKGYAEEASYIDRTIQDRYPGAKSMLELGSGTGRHAELLSQKGYQIVGIERSVDMLSVARQAEDGERLRFIQGDIRSFKLDQTFESAIALFHVMSYLTDNEDLMSTFNHVSKHLRKDGVFLFDCWYGPAVLTDLPAVRIKRLEDESLEVIRLAEPNLCAEESIVDVHYQIFVRDKEKGDLTDFKESHRMRYLFTNEITMMLNRVGMTLEASFEFMTGKPPGYDTWNVLYVGRKL